MGLHGIRRASYQMTQVFHGIPWNIPWNSMELWYPQIKYNLLLATPEYHEIPWNIPCKSKVTWHWTKWQSQSSMEFHGTKWYFIWRHQSSFRTPWNSNELGDSPFGGTRVPWNFMSLHLPWNFCSFMEFHGTSQLGLGIPWNSMEFGYIAEFHEAFKIPWNSMEHLCHLKWRPPNFMESLETRWFFCLVTAEVHGIPWNIPCKSSITWYWLEWQSENSMEFHGTQWYCIWRHQSSFRIPWNSLELGDSPFGGTRFPRNFVSLHLPWNFRSFMEFHETSQLGLGIPWNSMEFGYIAKFHGTFNIPWNSMELLNWL